MPLAVDSPPARAMAVTVTDEVLAVELADGRTITTPLAWYPRLVHATPEERQHFEMIGSGDGIHWPDLDEDLSVQAMLEGRPSGEGPESLKRWLNSRSQTASEPIRGGDRDRDLNR